MVKTLKRLTGQGLIDQEPYRAVFVTGGGWKLADGGEQWHMIVQNFPLALGVSPKLALVDCEGIEHDVSGETLKAMARFLDRG